MVLVLILVVVAWIPAVDDGIEIVWLVSSLVVVGDSDSGADAGTGTDSGRGAACLEVGGGLGIFRRRPDKNPTR